MIMRHVVLCATLLMCALACGTVTPPHHETVGSFHVALAPNANASSASSSSVDSSKSTPTTSKSRCAGDAAWIRELGQPPPIRSAVMRFDKMRQRGNFGPDGPVQTFRGLGGVTRRSQEMYDWPHERNPQATNRQIIILRGVTGGLPNRYATTSRLPNGVVEHQTEPILSDPPYSMFVFPGGTWVRAQGDVATRIRESLAKDGTPPPEPKLAADVAWELCGDLDQNEVSLPWDIWTTRSNRLVLRLFASHRDAELTYPFGTKKNATRAANAQRERCKQGKCTWLRGWSVSGGDLTFRVSVRKAPVSTRAVEPLIANTTPMLRRPPSPKVPTPGVPPSGTYQEFVEIKADTCPTRSAGGSFPRMHDLLLMQHRDGKAFTTIDSVEPRAPGIMTSSPMKNVELRVGHVARRETTHLCPNYKIVREMTVLEVTGDTIVVRDIVRHVGSTAGCRHRNLPSNCHHEAKTTLVLRRPSCAPGCNATYDGGLSFGSDDPAPYFAATCSCP